MASIRWYAVYSKTIYGFGGLKCPKPEEHTEVSVFVLVKGNIIMFMLIIPKSSLRRVGTQESLKHRSAPTFGRALCQDSRAGVPGLPQQRGYFGVKVFKIHHQSAQGANCSARPATTTLLDPPPGLLRRGSVHEWDRLAAPR